MFVCQVLEDTLAVLLATISTRDGLWKRCFAGWGSVTENKVGFGKKRKKKQNNRPDHNSKIYGQNIHFSFAFALPLVFPPSLCPKTVLSINTVISIWHFGEGREG